MIAKIAAASEPYRQWYAGLDDGVTDVARMLLRGSIDMHLHCDPSPQLRVMDAFQAAEEASAAGMRAIVLKDHLTGMEDSAFLAMAHADLADSFDVFGSHWLNNQTGGWNVYAVDKAVAFGAKLVGAPTLAAYGEKLRQQADGVHAAELIVKSVVPMTPRVVYTLDHAGAVRPEVIECLERIAEGGIAFGTGHLSTEEVWAAVHAAHERGVERICITHALMTAPAPPEAYRELCTATGAVCEFTTFQVLTLGDALVDTLRGIGTEHVTLSTDAGLKGTSSGVESYLWMLAKLLEAGFAEAEIDVMSKDVPARLLGIGARSREEVRT
jgi:Family of unknown function (DUF6282)